MATLIFSSLGTLVGGPLGGAVGALIGRQLDHAVMGNPSREGPRLKELAVTTSSYGSAIARHYGSVRAPGTIIWATDLVERTEEGGGGKGSPSITSYNYSVSFAVALSSRPIAGLGRIWADGNLLRGSAGDLKTGGVLRIYEGHGDQPVDPLIASDKGAACPAFRGAAYCVFESLELASFGNRIPALTFEILAGEGDISLAHLLGSLESKIESERPLAALTGFSWEGGPLASTLAAIDQVYPIACDAGGEGLTIRAADTLPADIPLLPERAVAEDGESFGATTGETRQRAAGARVTPDGMRYYDIARDYQAGLQRADGRARPGRSHIIEFPGALASNDARALVNAAAERAGWSRETLAWRMAELDPRFAPGSVVRAPGLPGFWRIQNWELRDQGVEVELQRLPRGPARQPVGDPGSALPPPDMVATPTQLLAYELPWNGSGSPDTRMLYAAVSSVSSGWTGASLHLERAGQLTPLGGSGSRRSIIGIVETPVTPSSSHLVERHGSIEVELISGDFALSDATGEGLAAGRNRALIGGEVIQFARAVESAPRKWRLSGLLRGRGGTEGQALSGHPAGTAFVLLDDAPVTLDPAKIGPSEGASLVAIGLADTSPVRAQLANPGLSLRPLAPVHPRVRKWKDGGLRLSWTRRARGAWTWPDEVEIPINEQSERYIVGLGEPAAPSIRWETTEPTLEIGADAMLELVGTYAGAPLWVRQAGSFALSSPLFLTRLA